MLLILRYFAYEPETYKNSCSQKESHKGERGEDTRDHRAAPSLLSAALLCFLFHIFSFLGFFDGTGQPTLSPHGYASSKCEIFLVLGVFLCVMVLFLWSNFGPFSGLNNNKLNSNIYRFSARAIDLLGYCLVCCGFPLYECFTTVNYCDSD